MTTESIRRERFVDRVHGAQDRIEHLREKAARLKENGKDEKANKVNDRANELSDRLQNVVSERRSHSGQTTEPAPKKADVGQKLDVVA